MTTMTRMISRWLVFAVLIQKSKEEMFQIKMAQCMQLVIKE